MLIKPINNIFTWISSFRFIYNYKKNRHYRKLNIPNIKSVAKSHLSFIKSKPYTILVQQTSFEES